MRRAAAPDDDLAPYCCRSLGNTLLLTAVVGSGIMGKRLALGNVAIALLANTVATAAILITLIFTFGPISRAHFNTAVTVADAWQCGIAWRLVPLCIAGQIAGAFLGVIARSEAAPGAVGLYIRAAYRFTASTSFANPAVSLARAFTDTFAGIRLLDVPEFVSAKCFIATASFRWPAPSLPFEANEVVSSPQHPGP